MKNQIIKGTISENSFASRYDRLHATPSDAMDRAKTFPPISEANKIIADYLQDWHGNLLEVGCGRGELLIQSPSHFDVKIGIDFSEVFLKDAVLFTEKYSETPEKIQWILHDLNEKWPFEDAYFDVVVSAASIEHIFDVYHIFRESNRCLKNGGYFYFSVPNIAYIKHRVRLLFGLQPVTASSLNLWWRDYWDGTHLHYFTIGAVRMLCRQTGFDIVEVTGSGSYRHLRKWWTTLLCGDMIVTAKKVRGL